MWRPFAIVLVAFVLTGCVDQASLDREQIAERSGSNAWTLGYRISETDGECIALSIETGAGILGHERCTRTGDPVAWYLDGPNGIRYTWGRINEVQVTVEQDTATLVLLFPSVEGTSTRFVTESRQDAATPVITFLADGLEIARVRPTE